MAGHVLLIGMMGAGKTTVGRALGARLDRPYFDNDAMVEQSTGRTVPEIWQEDGEAAFRREEARALERATSSPVPSVIAVAGGAVLDGRNRERISSAGQVVWLRAKVATLADRVGHGEGRPLLSGPEGPAASLARLAEERRPVYAELADVEIEVDDSDVEQVVERIVAELDLA